MYRQKTRFFPTSVFLESVVSAFCQRIGIVFKLIKHLIYTLLSLWELWITSVSQAVFFFQALLPLHEGMFLFFNYFSPQIRHLYTVHHVYNWHWQRPISYPTPLSQWILIGKFNLVAYSKKKNPVISSIVI